MSKFNITKAVEKGVVNVGKLADEQFVLVVATQKKVMIVPMLATSKSRFAFIDDAKYDVEDYSMLTSIIEAINAKKTYKELKEYKIMYKKAGTHSLEITEWLRVPGVTTTVKDLNKTVEEEGYKVSTKTFDVFGLRREYKILTDTNEEARTLVEDQRVYFKKKGFDYMSLDKEIRDAFEDSMIQEEGGLILIGKTGTGKSVAVRLLADHLGAPVYYIQGDGGKTSADIEGEFIPNEDPSIPAKYVYAMADVLKAWVFGGFILIDEINFLEILALSCIYKFSDGTQVLHIAGKTYKKNPNCMIFATMNSGADGSNELPKALKNRFDVLDFEEISEKVFVERLKTFSGERLSTVFFSKLYKFMHFMEKQAESSIWHESYDYSIRNAQRFITSILRKPKTLEEFTQCIFRSYVNGLSLDNENYEKLKSFKKEKDVLEQIKDLYDSYDFAESKEIPMAKSLDAFFEEEDVESTESKSKDAMMDDLLKRFDF